MELNALVQNFFECMDLSRNHFARQQLERILTLKSYPANSVITTENNPADTFEFIVSGKVRVMQQTEFGNSFVCILQAGDIIGVNPTHSAWHTAPKRTRSANTLCITETTTYSLSQSDASHLLQQYPALKQRFAEKEKQLCVQQFLRMICQGEDISTALKNELITKTETTSYPKDTVLFKQNDPPDFVYFILDGTVNLTHTTAPGDQKGCARLATGHLFGEIALLSGSFRNATAVTQTDTTLLRLNQTLFLHFIQNTTSARDFIQAVHNSRVRPTLIPDLIQHYRYGPNGVESIVLEHPEQHHFIELPVACQVLLDAYNGDRSLKEILHDQVKAESPVDPGLLTQAHAQLITRHFTSIGPGVALKNQVNLSTRLKERIQAGFNIEYTTGSIQPMLQKLHSRGGHLIYQWWAQLFIWAMMLTGACLTWIQLPLLFHLRFTELTRCVLVTLFLSILSLLGHEIAHGLTATHYKGQCYRAGIGWYWISLVAYIDTSCMWNKSRSSRMKVNVAGIVFNLVFASLLLLPTALGWVGLPWQQSLVFFSVMTYFSVLVNLSSVLDYDGYYLLADYFESPQLRLNSVRWLKRLVRRSPSAPTQPTSKSHRAEMGYWLYTAVHITITVLFTQFLLISILLPACGAPVTSSVLHVLLQLAVAVVIIVIAARQSSDKTL